MQTTEVGGLTLGCSMRETRLALYNGPCTTLYSNSGDQLRESRDVYQEILQCTLPARAASYGFGRRCDYGYPHLSDTYRRLRPSRKDCEPLDKYERAMTGGGEMVMEESVLELATKGQHLDRETRRD